MSDAQTVLQSLNPYLAPAVIGGIIALPVSIITAIVGWAVTIKVGRMTTRVAEGQLAISHQQLVLNLMERRLACRQEVIDAIEAREDEVQRVDPVSWVGGNSAIKQLWEAQMAAAVLFGDDVTVPLDEVEKAINRKSQLLLDLRLADEFEKEIADRIQSESFNIVMLKGDILKAIDAYSRLGAVRVKD